MRNPVWLSALLFAIIFTATAASAADSASTQSFSWSGLVDVYYSKNFNGPSNQLNQFRNFDIYENQFSLNLAKLTLQETAKPVGFRLDLGFGTANDVVQGLLNPLTGATSPMTSTLDLVEQAYIETVLPVGSGLTVDVGKFVTLMGNEVIESNGNWNYSRSFSFAYAIPYYHEGIRATYSFTGNFTAAVYLVNDWNSVVSINRSKTVALGLTYSPTSTTTLVVNGMSGFEQPLGAEYGKTNLAEIILSQSLDDNLSLAADGVFGEERIGGVLGTWKGIALYAKYNLTSKSDLALRGEVYYDPLGYTTGLTIPRATLKEVTLTYEYRPWSPLIVRIEGRDDFANGNAFLSASSISATDFTRTSQPTILVGLISTF